MVRKVICSLVVLGLIVGGVGVLQAIGEGQKETKSTKQGVKKEEKIHVNPNKSVQSVSNKVKSQTPKVVKIMNTKGMIEEVFEMVIEERVEDEEKYLSCDLHPIYPTLSPDNKKVAYILPEGIGYGGIETEGQIWLRDLATLDDTSVYLGINASEPDFSPDGKQIVCVIEGQVYKMDIDGKNKVKLTNFEKSYIFLSPKWSPDGEKILLNIVSGYKLHFITSDGSKYITIPSSIGGGGDWSPDGKKIVMIAGEKNYKHNLWTINIDDSKTVQLTTDGNADPDYIPSWSPNGKKIAYTIYGDEKCSNYIMIINADGSNPTKLLLPNNMFGICPVWSKDGKRLLIVGKKDIKHPLEKYEHYATGMYILTLPDEILK